jgi:hypothetical protein
MSFRRGLSISMLAVAVLFLGVATTLVEATTTITTETVYNAGISQNIFLPSLISSLAMDASGNPHVSFVDNNAFDFKYGTKSGGVWTFESIAPNGYDPIFGDDNQITSLALDASGNPHIAFWDPTPNLLKYASRTGGTWTIETVDPVDNNGRVATLVIDATDRPHIFYYDQTNLYVKYATKVGGVWSTEVVDASGILQPRLQGLAVDSSGNPHVIYLDFNAGVLKYAKKSGGVWTSEVVPGPGSFPGSSIFSSIAVDGAGNPHLALSYIDTRALRHVVKSGGVWTSEFVDPGKLVADPSIRISPAGTPCISYKEITIGTLNLKYATRTGGTWSSVVVDAPGNVGGASWLAFDASGNAHITYGDRTNLTIKYASIESSGGGNVAGTLSADCPTAGTPLYGVTVDAFTSPGGMLAGTTATNASGGYTFEGLATGDYNIVVVKPLGYSAAVVEQIATVLSGQTTTANFPLTCDTSSGDVQAAGFWKHQVGVATTGQGHALVDATTLCSYLDLIAEHFNSNQVNPVVVYLPPASGDCGDKLASAATLLNLQGSAAMRDKAKQSLLALLLNVASGRLGTMSVVSKDGATASQAITYCDNQIDSPTGNYSQAKSITDNINDGKKVAAGMIPLGTVQIAYRAQLAVRTFTVTPNPGPVMARTFSFTMGKDGTAKLDVYDVSGRLVTPLANGPLSAGPHTVAWDGRTSTGGALRSGIYFARLESSEGSRTLKVIMETR